VGIDVIEIDRVAAALARHGGRFAERCFSAAERAYCDSRANPAQHYAGRFAAKEAIVKAMGTGFAHGVWIRDIGVVHNAWGKPEVIYSKRGERVRRRLGIGEGHVTLTDEAGLIVAVAILMRARRLARRAAAPVRRRAARAPRPLAGR